MLTSPLVGTRLAFRGATRTTPGRRIIIRDAQPPTRDPHAVALEALAWIIADPARARRFLDLTGLSPDALRSAAASSRLHRAVFEFLASHEADFVAAAQALELDPGELVAAQRELHG